jgi:hypothetical protein
METYLNFEWWILTSSEDSESLSHKFWFSK